MKSILCKSTKYTKQKKKRVTFKDDYEKKYFKFLILFTSITLSYSLYCFITSHFHILIPFPFPFSFRLPIKFRIPI